jgi:hypothetical protein
MQLLAFIGHSGFVLESMFLEFFKMGIFTTKIHLFLENSSICLKKSIVLGLFNNYEAPLIYLVYFYTY